VPTFPQSSFSNVSIYCGSLSLSMWGVVFSACVVFLSSFLFLISIL